MKHLSILFILFIFYNCKTTTISDNSIVGIYKHGYTYPLNDYGLAEHDSIFINLKDDHTFRYDRYYFGVNVVSHEENSYGKWHISKNKIILNSDDKKLKLKIDSLSSLPKYHKPKLRFSYDFLHFGDLNFFEYRINKDLNKAFYFYLCENSKNCYDLNKYYYIENKLFNKDTVNRIATYEKLIYLDLLNVLKPGKEYYFEVKVIDKFIEKYESPINRKSIKSDSFINKKNINEFSLYLQEIDDDFFYNEQDLDFYPLTNVKIHINKNNELKLKKRKLFKADSIFRYNWESKDEYKKSMGW